MDKAKIGVIIHKNRWPGVLAEEDFRRLKKLGRVVATKKAEALTDDEAIAILKDCDVAIGSWGTPKPNEAIMAGCPKLKLWVHAAGTGTIPSSATTPNDSRPPCRYVASFMNSPRGTT